MYVFAMIIIKNRYYYFYKLYLKFIREYLFPMAKFSFIQMKNKKNSDLNDLRD